MKTYKVILTETVRHCVTVDISNVASKREIAQLARQMHKEGQSVDSTATRLRVTKISEA